MRGVPVPRRRCCLHPAGLPQHRVLGSCPAPAAPDPFPMSPSCPGDPPQHPPILPQHLPSVPILLQCCPRKRHVLSWFLPTSCSVALGAQGQAPTPVYVAMSQACPRGPPELCPTEWGDTDRVWCGLGSALVGHASLGKPLSSGVGAVTALTLPPGPAALPERRGEAGAEPTSGAEAAPAAVLAPAWSPLTGQGAVPEGAGVSRVTSPSLSGVTRGPDVTGGH